MPRLFPPTEDNRPHRAARNYARAFPKYPPLSAHGGWLAGTWMIGNNYRRTNDLYGAYPPSYLKRVHSMFPEARRVLHLFSGGLTEQDAAAFIEGVEVDHEGDMHADKDFDLDLVDSKGPDEGRYPTHQGDVTDLPEEWASKFDLVLADPPYSADDAKKYGVKMPNIPKVMREAARVTKPGGNLVWLSTSFPMYRSDQWKLWGTIQLLRSTNHRVRGVFIFETV